jgi:tellurite resistance protein
MTPFPPALRPEPSWARTPPALFPACLGLIGAGLAWRAAGAGSGLATAMAEIWLGAALAVYALCVLLYARKVAARPAALGHDLRMPAGRGAVPAISVGMMLAAAALAPVAPGTATAIWAAALALHAVIVALLTRELFALPPDGRPATAPLFVAYAGYVVAPNAGAALGFQTLSWWLLAIGAVGWLSLLPFVLRRLATARVAPPPPLRPGAAVLLAPPAMVATALDRLGADPRLEAASYAVALLTLAGLLWSWRWLTAGGWTPAWGAFTFPACAFATATAAAVPGGFGLGATAATVTLASLLTLYVAGRMADAWAKGRLAP